MSQLPINVQPSRCRRCGILLPPQAETDQPPSYEPLPTLFGFSVRVVRLFCDDCAKVAIVLGPPLEID